MCSLLTRANWRCYRARTFEGGGWVQFSRFVGLDVHDQTTSICMRDREGRILHETVIPTSAAALRRYFRVHRGRIAVTVEEGSLAGWVYQILHDRVADLLVCNPRHNRLLNAGSKSDRIDARKLSELLRLGALTLVHHDAQPLRFASSWPTTTCLSRMASA
jgi:hypothetical protein